MSIGPQVWGGGRHRACDSFTYVCLPHAHNIALVSCLGGGGQALVAVDEVEDVATEVTNAAADEMSLVRHAERRGRHAMKKKVLPHQIAAFEFDVGASESTEPDVADAVVAQQLLEIGVGVVPAAYVPVTPPELVGFRPWLAQAVENLRLLEDVAERSRTEPVSTDYTCIVHYIENTAASPSSTDAPRQFQCIDHVLMQTKTAGSFFGRVYKEREGKLLFSVPFVYPTRYFDVVNVICPSTGVMPAKPRYARLVVPHDIVKLKQMW